MRIGLPAKLGLTADEKKIIKRVAIASVAASALVVSVIWVLQMVSIKRQGGTRSDPDIAAAFTKGELIPIDIDAHRFVASRLMERGQPEQAILHMHRILALQRSDRATRASLGSALLESGLYEKAIREFDIVAEGYDDSLTALALARRGSALFYAGKIIESRKALIECLARFPGSAEASCFLGQIEASHADSMQKATVLLRKAVEIDSLYVEGWYQLARFSMQSGDYTDARGLLQRSLEIDPLHIKSHSRLGMVYYYMGNFELARKSYQTALALNPHDFNTRYNLGELYYSSLNNHQNALKEFKLALRDNPGHIEANFKAGLICTEAGLLKESARFLEQAASNASTDIRILLQLAVSYEKLGFNDKALSVYQRILSIDALNTVARQKTKFLIMANSSEKSGQ